MKNNKSAYLPFLFALVLIVGIFIGSIIKQPNVSEKLLIYPRTDKLNTLINYIEQKYVDTISKNKLTESLIPQIMEELDPHSVYIPARQVQKYNEPLVGNFSGIGVQFNMIKDTIVIIRTIPNGPSEKVGILAGDRIIKVFTQDVAGVNMPTDTVVSKLRGPKGSMVRVTVYRKEIEDTVAFEIIRDDIPLYSLDASYMISDEIGYLKLSKFSSSTFEEFLSAIEKLRGLGMKKLIFDLRGNGGGYLNSAIAIADQFLSSSNLIVYTEGRASSRKNFFATAEGNCLDLKVNILIDEYSASASEILAGAIQDNDRGTIIGRRSFGKGLVGEQTEFNDGSALRLTIARYYTPTGRCIQKPYKNGHDDYYDDINKRYEHGEFFNADSIIFADSLKYTTPKGKIVYGGGGIMPDIFVPVDTLEISPFFAHVKNRGLIYRFAFDYTDKNRAVINQHTDDVESLVKYLNSQNLTKMFLQFAKLKGEKIKNHDIETSRKLLEVSLKANIARNIFDNEGYYPIIQEIDNTLQIAIQEFNEN